MRIRFLAAVLLSAVHAMASNDSVDPPVTVAERSGYEETSTSADVEAFLETLHKQSERTWLGSIGTSNNGQDLPLLVVADPPVSSAEEARASNKLVVLLFGNIHSGEVCGKEALQMLARELALGECDALLDDLIICFVPNINPDGNDDMAHDHRPGQDGPAEMGTRPNAQGLDMNRDWIKLEAPEAQSIVRFMREWDPAVVVDTHTTNGSHHRYVLTYQGPKHPASDPRLVEFARDTFLPEIDDRFEEETDYNAFFYGNFADGHTKWTTYPASPRYGAAYRGLRNRISILSEAYAYATFKDRVLATLEFCRAVLYESAEHKDVIETTIAQADRFNDTEEPREVALRARAKAFPGRVSVMGYQEYDAQGNRIEVTDEERDYEVEFVNDFEATLLVDRPWAYIIPSDYANIAHHLQLHGVEIHEIREEMDADVEAYRLDEMKRASRSFQGHQVLNIPKVTALSRGVRIEPGWFLVRTEQSLGNLASYMLEPQATDSLAAWNFFDGVLEEGGEYPIYRLPEPLTILARPAQALEEDRLQPKRITSDMIVHRRDMPRLNGPGTARLRWLDDDHLSKTVPGTSGTVRVNATTGRIIDDVRDMDWERVADVIAELPTIDDNRARQIARQSFRFGRDSGLVFEHASDLYYVSADGHSAVRLTATPEREQTWSMSPDGKFVAFINDYDLHVVDIATQTTRALTTGGTDVVRHGMASWVYFEELFGRNWKAYWWSPDSSQIAFLITDSSAVPEYTIVDNQRREQRIEVERYTRPGERNPEVELGFVSPHGGSIRTADLSGYDDGLFLISGVSWTPDSRNCVLHVQNRIQTWLDVLHVSPRGGTPKKLMRETTEAWVTSPGAFTYLEDGSFLMPSERDGFEHLYHYKADGTLIRQVTSGEWECRRLQHVDEENGLLYFTGTERSHIGNDLYRIGLDGTGLTRLSHEPGTHSVSLNPSATLFIDSWSSLNEPTRSVLRNTNDGAIIRWLDTNPVYEREQYQLARVEHVNIPTRHEGIELEGIVHYPPDFAPSQTYPIWVMTYAGVPPARWPRVARPRRCSIVDAHA